MQFAAQLKVIVVVGVIALLISLFSLLIIERTKRQSAESELDLVTDQYFLLTEANARQVMKINLLHKQGIKHIAELSAAQEKIDQLNDRLRSGSQRVLVKADCPAMSDTDTTRGVGNERAARLSQSAREDYIRLRRMMVDSVQQIKYLQNYIKYQCVN